MYYFVHFIKISLNFVVLLSLTLSCTTEYLRMTCDFEIRFEIEIETEMDIEIDIQL